jgi:hypothetical protein
MGENRKLVVEAGLLQQVWANGSAITRSNLMRKGFKIRIFVDITGT